MKIKITAKFRASRRLRFEDTKRNMAPEIRQKSFGTFEKQAPSLKSFGPLRNRPQGGDVAGMRQNTEFEMSNNVITVR